MSCMKVKMRIILTFSIQYYDIDLLLARQVSLNYDAEMSLRLASAVSKMRKLNLFK